MTSKELQTELDQFFTPLGIRHQFYNVNGSVMISGTPGAIEAIDEHMNKYIPTLFERAGHIERSSTGRAYRLYKRSRLNETKKTL